MKDAKLGRLRRLDIRRFWEDQDSDFRSWLSQEENMGLLGETVGLELEPLARDPAAAATHTELPCRDTVSDRWIVVAADAEETDDARLGQVLAQAAGLNAGTVIWVSSRFDDAQRATLDWLNEITDTRFHFFGLEVELWQIEDSPAAPRFNVVAKPNDWVKTLGGKASRLRTGGPAATKQILQLEYWTLFRERLLRGAGTLRPPKAYPQNSMNFAVGRSNFRLTASISVKGRSLAVALVMDGPDAKAHFHLLLREREEVERDLGTAELEWREQTGKRESAVVLQTGADPAAREGWEEQHGWLLERLEQFHRVFSPRVRTLDADEYAAP